MARITKQGSQLTFQLDEDNDGDFDWTSSVLIDIAATPSGGSGAYDYRFLQDEDSGHLFVGTGWMEREFDNFRVYLPGDMNGDGQVSDADINPMVLALTNRTLYEAAFPDIDLSMTGDLDGSGSFNLGDLGLFSAMVSASGAGESSTNGAGNGGAVPEPSSLSLLALVLLPLFLSRRTRE